MVEFRFDIKPLFPQEIIKVSSNLLPHTFRGDRRQCFEATAKLSEIINRFGELSAVAQHLNKSITTAQRLRMAEDQTVYLLADRKSGRNGCVTGLLKVGRKDLYLVDESGKTRQMPKVPSILDFYVHETYQRHGLGKCLFEKMLTEEHWTPIKCSVDRPSKKMLGFLRKHYGLVRTIPQANNFVLYEGFFDKGEDLRNGSIHKIHGNGDMQLTKLTKSPYLFGDEAYQTHRHGVIRKDQETKPNVLMEKITPIKPAGRYGLMRPICSMAEIIQDSSLKYKKGGVESSRT